MYFKSCIQLYYHVSRHLVFVSQVFHFPALRYLDATHNQIHSLPDELGDLGHLETLYLRHNRLTHLPILEHCTGVKVRKLIV